MTTNYLFLFPPFFLKFVNGKYFWIDVNEGLQLHTSNLQLKQIEFGIRLAGNSKLVDGSRELGTRKTGKR
jgi:hypothetical protein